MFVLVDHASNEVWYDAARRMDRFAAADLLREVCAERFGSVERAVAAGLALRYDGGSCFRSDHYQAEIDHLGIARSPAFHYEPETTAGYGPQASEVVKSSIFDGLTEAEMREMLHCEGDQRRSKPALREGITWQVGDASDPQLVSVLGSQDLVIANNFLCHMDAPSAEKCLRNLAQLVRPGGYIVVSGVDLDVRTKVALDLRWAPVAELMDEIHDGDVLVRADWPWEWWGLEPLDRRRADWQTRYASVFRIEER